MHRETRFSCDPDHPEGVVAVDGPVTMSTSALCSMAADLAMMQMLRLTLGLGADITDTLLEYNAYRCRTVLSPLVRNADCPAEHRSWVLREPPRALGRCTLQELALKAGVPRGRIQEAAFMVNERRFYEIDACSEGHVQPLGRFLTRPAPGQGCWTCGRPTWPRAFDSYRPVPGSALGEAGSRPIEEISDEPVTWVLVRDARHAVMFCDPTPQKPEVTR
jgi:hypothetical protein